MIVLVTGASGFIGSALCRGLADQGHHVRAFHRSTSSLTALGTLPIEHWVGDILDPASLDPPMRDAEVVFHTAAEMGAWRDPQANHRSHVTGTRNVLQAARRAGVRRFVHTSSVASLGVPDRAADGRWQIIDEHHKWNLLPDRWPYGYAKHEAEEEVVRAVEQGLDAVIVNPSVVAGPGDVYRSKTGILPLLAGGAWIPAVVGGLNAVHIDDVVAGHLAAASHGRAGERYILGGENLTIARFLQTSYDVVGRKPTRLVLPAALVRAGSGMARLLEAWLRLPIAPDFLRLAGYDFFYDGTKARNELRLQPPKTYRQAASETLAWYRQVGLL